MSSAAGAPPVTPSRLNARKVRPTLTPDAGLGGSLKRTHPASVRTARALSSHRSRERRELLGLEGGCVPSSRALPQSVARSLHSRAARPALARSLAPRLGHETFRRFGVDASLDTHSESEVRRFKLSFLRRRSYVTEVVAARDVLIVLLASGACVAFDAESGSRLCSLNARDDEVVRSIFHNRVAGSLITVSVFRDDNFGSLKCHSVPLDEIRAGEPTRGRELFAGESLHWPGYVEFDDVNGKVLTFSAQQKVHKIWDLRNYEELFEIRDPSIQELKISPGLVLLIYQRAPASIPLAIVDIRTGEVLRKLKITLLRARPVDFIEQFDSRILIKQEGSPLRLIELDKRCEEREVPETRFATPAAFIFLYERQLFLTFRGGNVSVWNQHAEPVATFSDRILNFQDINSNNIFITRDQRHILSYFKPDFYLPGVISVASISTGKCLATIEAGSRDGAPFSSPLHDVTALSYDEETGRLYAGSRDGKVFIFKALGDRVPRDLVLETKEL